MAELNPAAQRARSAQVGFVMRPYLEAFLEEDGRRGISQDELLRRMTAVDDSFSPRFSHATVSRWEAGATRPTVERFRIFGRALNLSDDEVLGLIALAGLELDPDPATHRERCLRTRSLILRYSVWHSVTVRRSVHPLPSLRSRGDPAPGTWSRPPLTIS